MSALKAHLSEVLAEVRGGASVIVCDRNTPIARLVPYDDPNTDDFRVDDASALATSGVDLPRQQRGAARPPGPTGSPLGVACVGL